MNNDKKEVEKMNMDYRSMRLIIGSFVLILGLVFIELVMSFNNVDTLVTFSGISKSIIITGGIISNIAISIYAVLYKRYRSIPIHIAIAFVFFFFYIFTS